MTAASVLVDVAFPAAFLLVFAFVVLTVVDARPSRLARRQAAAVVDGDPRTLPGALQRGASPGGIFVSYDASFFHEGDVFEVRVHGRARLLPGYPRTQVLARDLVHRVEVRRDRRGWTVDVLTLPRPGARANALSLTRYRIRTSVDPGPFLSSLAASGFGLPPGR